MPNWAYRLMVWEYRIHDLLGLDKPQSHLSAAPVRAGMVVVDWGCGPGRYTGSLAQLVGKEGKVYAVDIQPMAIQLTRDRLTREQLANVVPLLIDSYTTLITSSSVDLVLLLHTLHSIGDVDALLGEVRRILRPGGYLFMDSGHLKIEAAIERVTRSGLFRLVERRGSHMLMAPAGQSRPLPR
jgi:ubiquinone/menaquinone biosynthesis C-methylase UbiE